MPLDGGFELLFGRAGEALRRGGVSLALFSRWDDFGGGAAHSFLNMVGLGEQCAALAVS